MTPREILHFDTRRIGRTVLVYDSVASTNDLAMASNDDGAVFVANDQTRGRGQFGRVWQSRPGTSLLLSARLPPVEVSSTALTAMATVAAAETVIRLTNTTPKIKWPNDLVFNGKKACGILIERGQSIVVGIGLNLNQTLEDFEQQELPHATSLALVAKAGIDPRTALEILVRELDDSYSRLTSDKILILVSRWAELTTLKRKIVTCERNDGSTIRGRLLELTFERIGLETDSGVVAIRPESVTQLFAAD